MKLEIGYKDHFEIRNESTIADCDANFSVLYISDLHFNKFSKKIALKIIDTITELNPDIILLGGDYVDSKKGLEYLELLVLSLAQRKNVFAIAGNHDQYFGLDVIEKVMANNNITWIEQKEFIFKIKNTNIRIDGSKPQKIKSNADFSILCLHKPIGIEEYQDNYNLVFAGHLHGSQFVFWKQDQKLYPGKLFYKWNILKTKLNSCHYYISKGLGDTLPVRYNCKKDLIFVTVTPNNTPKIKNS